MKLKSEDIERIEFKDGDCVSRCDSIWVGSLGEYTTTYGTLTEFLKARRDGWGEKYEIFRQAVTGRIEGR